MPPIATKSLHRGNRRALGQSRPFLQCKIFEETFQSGVLPRYCHGQMWEAR